MSLCSKCPYPDECAERRACQRRITVAESNEIAQAMNAYNARVGAAVDDLLICLARAAVKIIGGAVLGLYAIGAVWGGA